MVQDKGAVQERSRLTIASTSTSPAWSISNRNTLAKSESLMKVPFEIRAYEGLLFTAIAMYRQEYIEVEDGYSMFASGMSNGTGSLFTIAQQQDLFKLKERVIELLQSIKSCVLVLQRLLAEDESLVFLNLSSFNRKPEAYSTYK